MNGVGSSRNTNIRQQENRINRARPGQLESSSPDERDNFDPISVDQHGRLMRAARDEFPVPLDGHAGAVQVQFFEQCGDGRPGRQLARCVIDG